MKRALTTIFLFLLLILSVFACKEEKTNQTTTKSEKTGDILPVNYSTVIQIQERLRDIGKNETPSVVFISTEKIVKNRFNRNNPFFFQNPGQNRSQKEQGLGSGVIYKKNGNNYYIITNNHVIEGADSIEVAVDEEKIYTGQVLGADPAVDIAVVKITTKDTLYVASFGNSEQVIAGDLVIAVGNPFGLSNTMTFGIVSAVGRSNVQTDQVSLTDFIQTDAAINPGNSGGPLLNIDGDVIGINTMIYSRSGGSVGIGFSVPVNVAVNTAEQIIKNGKVEHGYLGIYFRQITEEDAGQLGLKLGKEGFLVMEVIEKSPADKQGLKSGDVILELDGKKVKNTNEFARLIGNSTPGQTIRFKVAREDNIIDLKIKLGKK